MIRLRHTYVVSSTDDAYTAIDIEVEEAHEPSVAAQNLIDVIKALKECPELKPADTSIAEPSA